MVLWGETTTWGWRSLGISGEEPGGVGIWILWGGHSSGEETESQGSNWAFCGGAKCIREEGLECFVKEPGCSEEEGAHRRPAGSEAG